MFNTNLDNLKMFLVGFMTATLTLGIVVGVYLISTNNKNYEKTLAESESTLKTVEEINGIDQEEVVVKEEKVESNLKTPFTYTTPKKGLNLNISEPDRH